MFKVFAKCQECGLDQLVMNIVDVGDDGRFYAERFASIVDGSSDFFVRSPRGDPSTSIGKCGICYGQIDCRVEDA